MKSNISIRIHARAGQGSKTMAQFIAESVAKTGKYVQAFPYYGPARSGAPMDAYVRVSDKEIRIHSVVKHPDIFIILDDTLLLGDNADLNLEKDQILILNTKKEAEQAKKDYNVKGDVHVFDASEIASEMFGYDFANTVMLGALAKISDQIDLKAINQVVEDKFLKKLGEEMTAKNIEAIKKGYDSVEG